MVGCFSAVGTLSHSSSGWAGVVGSRGEGTLSVPLQDHARGNNAPGEIPPGALSISGVSGNVVCGSGPLPYGPPGTPFRRHPIAKKEKWEAPIRPKCPDCGHLRVNHTFKGCFEPGCNCTLSNQEVGEKLRKQG